jgi:hypothetical protein
MPKFDRYVIQAAHKILKREAGIAFIVMRKIHLKINLIYITKYNHTQCGSILSTF